MESDEWKVGSEKISAEFAARLSALAPDEMIRVVVLINLGEGNDGKRVRGAERVRLIAETKAKVDLAQARIGAVLGEFNGQILSSAPTLGSLTVELEVAGIQYLARLESITTIVEDQSVNWTNP